MTRDELMEYALTLCGAGADCPFEGEADKEYTVLRHKDTGKWFGLLMKLDGGEAVNLKCEPLNADFLRGLYKGVVPAYHMNKTHWNTVFLDSDVPGEEIKNLVDQSFELTRKKPRAKKGKENDGEAV